MIRFFFRWLLRLAVPLALFVLFFVQGVPGAILAWALFAYLLLRAWPAVRKDLRRLWQAGRRVTASVARF